MDMDMDMGGMDMGSSVPGVPSLDFLMQYYWAVVGSFIGIAALVNFGNILICRQRLSAARRGHAKPAKPEAFLLRVNATATAIIREASNATLSPLTIKGRTFHLPTVGRTSIVAANIVTLLVLCFYHFDLSDQWSFQDIGYRTGCISIAQLPLIFLLAGKNNIIGWLTGSSYERLNWLHRWTARCLLLTVTIHMGYWFADWAPYNYIGRKITTDPITQHGLISWCLLLWIVFSSVAPIRGLSYEFFVLQHLGSMAVFIAFVYMHVNSWPLYVRIYIILPIALVCFDRFVRSIWVIYNNFSIFHPFQRKEGRTSRLWACEASFTPLPHNTTRITIHNPPISWMPGQHVFLSCHTLVPLQSHPFTIASIPEDGKMEFYVKSEGGATARFFRHAEKLRLLPAEVHLEEARRKAVAIDGPYGRLRPLRQFDSVVLFAGSTGATFTVPLLRDIVVHWKNQHQRSRRGASPYETRLLRMGGVVTRRVRFVWVVKSRGQCSWFAAQLSQVAEEVAALREVGIDFDVDMSVYVTCDPSFTGDSKTTYSDDGGMKPPSTPPTLPTPIFNTPLNEKTFFKRSYDGTRITELEDRSSDTSTTHSSDEQEKRKSALETGTADEACGVEGTCCCQATVEEAEGISSSQQSPTDAIQPVICTCCNNANNSSKQPPRQLQPSPSFTSTRNPYRPSTPPPVPSLLQPHIHPAVSLLSGRPHPESITRRVLERALGETAVVVCGPPALACDVRAAVVRLSDERAVHRGTGAQGVWCHVEGFGW
ncbi:FAD-binding domain-containing protein [Lasiodiplodia theobromae]|uniref:FAD-binding domain-containing protein n=1 Tax=Lasiodiplodia theobromae TaxID=45133 RepID=UPI0015C3FE47|nr:FAD-binding domain-containing protein [Lasiodiplodia theobromae]KAF4537499.1 FAD-binding domain-containing protein [Lasiodiplodia theobromae]